MKKSLLTFSALTLVFAASSHAAPVTLTSAQMDTVSGGSFVCPVITTDAVLNSPKGITINGAYSILGPEVGQGVPMHATNDNGAGSPGGTFASPGDSGYTAIWYTE